VKRALITGITGQDGSYMAEFLLEKGYKVYGLVRRSSTETSERIKHLLDMITIVSGDLLDQNSLNNIIRDIKPDEVYHFAAQSFVPASWDQPILTGECTALGVTRILEALRLNHPQAKFYQASSSEMFGKVQETPQTETTRFYPRSPYGVAKVYGHWITINYRESHNIFAVSGILFNHESPRRGLEFVTRKITNAIAKIAKGEDHVLELGNLDAKRDWGYAADYMEAVWLMLQQKTPDDFVICSGTTHPVREFVEEAFAAADMQLTWQGSGKEEVGLVKGKIVVRINEQYYRPAEVTLLQGDYSKAARILGWKPKTSFKELAKMMVEADLKR